MCHELNDEIDRGEKAMRELAAHLIAMGATKIVQRITIGNQLVKIEMEIVAEV